MFSSFKKKDITSIIITKISTLRAIYLYFLVYRHWNFSSCSNDVFHRRKEGEGREAGRRERRGGGLFFCSKISCGPVTALACHGRLWSSWWNNSSLFSNFYDLVAFKEQRPTFCGRSLRCGLSAPHDVTVSSPGWDVRESRCVLQGNRTLASLSRHRCSFLTAWLGRAFARFLPSKSYDFPLVTSKHYVGNYSETTQMSWLSSNSGSSMSVCSVHFCLN